MRSRIPAAAALAAALAVSHNVDAFAIKHAESGEVVRWRRASVAWTVDRSVRDVPGAEEAVTAAVAAWTERGGAPKLVAVAPDAALEPGLDGTNAVFYAKEGFAPAGVALAVTVLSFDDRTGEVLDADIVLNGRYQLGTIDAAAAAPTAADDPGAETYDVRRILAHEMGHALGLSDELARKDALMYLYVARATALPAAPGADDLAGLMSLYGSSPSSLRSPAAAAADPVGCSGAVVARSGPRRAPGGALCSIGLLITALVMARSRQRGGRRAAGCTLVAAAVLVMPPVLGGSETTAPTTTTDVDIEAVVTAVTTTATRGIFRSELALARTGRSAAVCPAASRSVVWGGTIGGVRQVIGGADVPAIGDRVGVVAASRASGEGVVRVLTRISQ